MLVSLTAEEMRVIIAACDERVNDEEAAIVKKLTEYLEHMGEKA